MSGLRFDTGCLVRRKNASPPSNSFGDSSMDLAPDFDEFIGSLISQTSMRWNRGARNDARGATPELIFLNVRYVWDPLIVMELVEGEDPESTKSPRRSALGV